ncbi:hypothetical protein K1719_034516 [Acacia pycnantha]|nr:hypothetical protein K1719_034516 [Acacia pycnantha]
MLSSHSHDIPPYVSSFVHHLVNKYGKNSFMWFGMTPRVILMDPEKVKEVFNRNYDFPRPELIPIVKYIATGVANYEDDKWAKHRKIINTAFYFGKIEDGTCELDVRPWIKNFTEDAISRTAFGSSFEEVLMKSIYSVIYTKEKTRMKEIDRMVEASLMGIIEKKEKAMKAGDTTKRDLLGVLLESNHKEIEEQGRNKNNNVGLSMKDVIEECKLFYFAGQETTSSMLAWTMMLLGRYPDWQARAREEVLRVFGNQNPDYDGLSQLKI